MESRDSGWTQQPPLERRRRGRGRGGAADGGGAASGLFWALGEGGVSGARDRGAGHSGGGALRGRSLRRGVAEAELLGPPCRVGLWLSRPAGPALVFLSLYPTWGLGSHQAAPPPASGSPKARPLPGVPRDWGAGLGLLRGGKEGGGKSWMLFEGLGPRPTCCR